MSTHASRNLFLYKAAYLCAHMHVAQCVWYGACGAKAGLTRQHLSDCCLRSKSSTNSDANRRLALLESRSNRRAPPHQSDFEAAPTPPLSPFMEQPAPSVDELPPVRPVQAATVANSTGDVATVRRCLHPSATTNMVTRLASPCITSHQFALFRIAGPRPATNPE